MNRRTALAAAAALSLSITGLAAAAGATMHVFDAADASPNVGKVSPVSTITRPPVVERRVVVVDDPAPTAPVLGAGTSGSQESSGSTDARDRHGGAASAAPPATTPTVPLTHESESGHELGDD